MMRNKSLLSLLAVILLAVLFLLPQLKMPWQLIDDAENLRMGQEIDGHLASGDYSWILSYENASGRFRPAYWFWHWSGYKIFGFNALGHHFSHLVLYTLISILIFGITRKISSSNFAGLLSVVFFLLFYPSAENFYRLGTAEPQILLLYLLIVWRLVTLYFGQFASREPKVDFLNYILIFIVLGLAYLTKETSFVLIPAFIFLVIISLLDSNIKNKKKWFKFCGIFVLFNFVIFSSAFLIKQNYYTDIKGSYVQAYIFDFLGMLKRFCVYIKLIVLNYNFLLLIPVISFSFLLKIYLQHLSRSHKLPHSKLTSIFLWQVVLLLWFVLFLIIQTPWIYVMGRYLAPIIVWLAIFLGLEYGKNFTQEKGFLFLVTDKKLSFNLSPLSLLSMLTITLFLSYGVWRIVSMYYSVVKGERATQRLIQYLSEEIPLNGSLYVNFSDVLAEYTYELPLHLRLFYKRADIQVSDLRVEDKRSYYKGDMIISFKDNLVYYPWGYVKELFPGGDEVVKNEFGHNWRILRLKENSLMEVENGEE